MILEAKVVLAGAAFMAGLGAITEVIWSAVQSAGGSQVSAFLFSPDTLLNLVTTAGLIAAAYATLRSDLKARSRRELEILARLDRIEGDVAEIAKDVVVLMDRAGTRPMPQYNPPRGRKRLDPED